MDKNILTFLYGTAWKEEQTSQLVFKALAAGFMGIDTANQRKHYFEEEVGKGLKEAYQQLGLARDDLFLQTKYTYSDGQDHRLPYDLKAKIQEQVLMSCESSLNHLCTEYIDSLILHGLSQPSVFSERDREAWQAMELLHQQGKVKTLGVSNVSLEQLKELYSFARIKPGFVQNRCYAQLQWDKKIREYCQHNHMLYQGFSLLTANQSDLLHPKLAQLALDLKKTIPQIIFRFCQQLEMIPLTGTTSQEHMQQDLAIDELELTPEVVVFIEQITRR